MLTSLRLSLGIALVTLGIAACGGNVVVDGNSGALGQGVGLGQGDGPGTSTGTSTPPSTGTSTPPSTGTDDPPPHPTPVAPAAIALRYGDLQGWGPPMGSGGATPGGPPPPQADDTFLVLSGYGAECANPYGASKGGCDPDWRVFVVVPAAEVAAGTVLALPQSNAWFNATQPGPDPNSCSGAAGSLSNGTLTITSIDAAGTIHGQVDGLDVMMDEVPTTFPFAAVACPSSPPTNPEPQPDAPACQPTGGACAEDRDCCNNYCNKSGYCDP
jgi:hypothetical protein